MSVTRFFEERFTANPVNQPQLPFFHSCDAYYLQSILANKKLIPRECKVFNNEKLLYLFYGRPAYKSALTENSSLISRMPVCFIFKPACNMDMKRICAFDSGGYSLYESFMHPGMTVDNFLMTPNITSVHKTVDYFYDNNLGYFTGNPKNQISYDPIEFHIESYYNLLKDSSANKRDDRKASIEIQLNHELELTPDTLAAVILPSNLAGSAMVRRIITDELGAEIISIPNYGVASNGYYALIMEKTKEFFIKQNLIDGH
ncbi:hypothetical protein SAMN05216464_11398 [Mucilaginibacter pineti]|uniref:Uncharacterized protein n=1 Tax=Mucilaginibacter pineti TaxID=1391627 RepID=A0A1G7INA8_9SPHI|nr:hypothetical protein [Mucilaginibacter pineti]SDF14220.1 hypothetical protein SAMN05216464_11398 [Mucilaginibacter pineti]